MADSVYEEAVRILRLHRTKVLASLAEEIIEIGEPSDITSEQSMRNLLDEVSRFLWNLNEALAELWKEAPRIPEPAPVPSPRTALRIAVVHCPPGNVTDTVNQWFLNHPGVEVESIHFTNIDRGFACVVLHRLPTLQ